MMPSNIEIDLTNIIDMLDELDQKMINLNHKLNQHIKEGHSPYENKQNIGSRIVFDTSGDSSRGPIGDN